MTTKSTLATLAVLSLMACTGHGPSGPGEVDGMEDDALAPEAAGPQAVALKADGTVLRGEQALALMERLDAFQNNAPTAVLRTRPRAQPGEPYPVISGPAPLTVNFNLCRSSDPDQVASDDPSGEGDTINWQFHFGDDGTDPLNSDGSFNSSFAGFCRTEHTYQEGSYTATMSVTDKHLEDQSRVVRATARDIEKVTVIATSSRPEGCPAATYATSVWQAVGTPPNYRCHCPLTGRTWDFFNRYAPGTCFKAGFFGASWSAGDKCACF